MFAQDPDGIPRGMNKIKKMTGFYRNIAEGTGDTELIGYGKCIKGGAGLQV